MDICQNPDHTPENEFLRRLQAMSKARADRWHKGKPVWSLLEWAGAMCGEAGEAANVAKKIKRLDSGMQNDDSAVPFTSRPREEYVDHLATELADTILYAVCLANELDFDLQDLLQTVFNEKSEECDFPERM